MNLEKTKKLKNIRNIVYILLILSIVIFGFSFVYKNKFPETEEILMSLKEIPEQEELAMDSFIFSKGDYQAEIFPKYTYELRGLVVSLYDSEVWYDVAHKKDPFNTKDLCLVWSNNALSGLYQKGNFSHGEFTCYWYFNNSEDYKNFYSTEISNNHLIPADENIYKKIKQVRIGDQIRLKGYLSEYQVSDANGKKIYSRGTSTTREDIGNQSCETIYVTDFEILKKNPQLFSILYPYAKYALMGFLVLSFLLLFV